ncbi:transposase, partial [Mycolicibacterium thermoresistibile]
MATGKDADLALGEVGSTVEMAEALRVSGVVDDLLAQVDSGEVALTGEGG